MKTFSRLPAVLQRVPISRSLVYVEMAAGRFPKPIKLSSRINAWSDEEIDAYVEARMAERDSAAA